MAIQFRKGIKSDFEENKSSIVAGEPVLTTDTEELFIGTGNGEYIEVASKDYVDTTVGNIETLLSAI